MHIRLLNLIELARFIEPTAYKYGYHVAITGSALYGDSPDDIDVMLYWHDGVRPSVTPEALMELLFIGIPYTTGSAEDYGNNIARRVHSIECVKGTRCLVGPKGVYAFPDCKVDFIFHFAPEPWEYLKSEKK